MTTRILLALVFLASASSAFAQDALPFTRRPLSPEEFARACEVDDPSVLNVSCDKIVAVAQKLGYQVGNRQEWAAYIRRNPVVPCPQQEINLARVMMDDSIDLNFSRTPLEGELCSYDNNLARYIAPVTCWNLITSDRIPVYTAMRSVSPGSGSSSADSSVFGGGAGGPLNKESLDRAAREAAERAEAERAMAGQHSRSSDGARQNFFQRHKRWLIPVIAGAAAGATAAIFVRPWNENENENSTTVNIGR